MEKGKRLKIDVHRLVAKLFIPSPDHPDKIEVHHINSNPYDPRAINLEWVTPSENCQYKYNNDCPF